MNATEHAALLDGLKLHDELNAAVDDRTLAILERRRRTAVIRRRGWLVRRTLLAADLVGLVVALIVAEWLVAWRSPNGALDARAEMLAFVASLPAWVVIAKLYGLYDRDEERTDHSTADDFAGVFHMITVCTWLFWVFTYVTGVAHPTAPKLVLFWACAVGLVSAGRALSRAAVRRNPLYLQNAIIVGAGDVGQLVAKKLLNHPEYGVNIVGFVDGQPKPMSTGIAHVALLGGIDRVAAIVRLFDVERVIVAFSNESHEQTLGLINELKQAKLDVQVDIVPRLFETFGPRAGVHMIEGLPLVTLPPARLSRSSALLKRTVDLGMSFVLLVLLAPLFAIIALAIKLDSRGPVLYRHERVGRGGRPIEVLKFRTMKRDACRGSRYGGEEAEEAFAALISDPKRAGEFAHSYKFTEDPRVTRVGRLLRSSSLDEFPQFLNVLRGDISLVGPRAVTVDELTRYGDRVDELMGFRPGITGYWQINGRSRLSYEDRVRLDLSYISGWSLRLDFEILARTLAVLIARRGAV